MQIELQVLDANRSSCYTFKVVYRPGIQYPDSRFMASGPNRVPPESEPDAVDPDRKFIPEHQSGDSTDQFKTRWP